MAAFLKLTTVIEKKKNSNSTNGKKTATDKPHPAPPKWISTLPIETD